MNTQLEKIIDENGLVQCIDEIADICGEKAMHIDVNWQDNFAANEWRKAAFELHKIANKLSKLSL